MDCPKCGHRQDDTIKCESCGVYFEKVSSPPGVPVPRRARQARATPEKSGFGAGALVLTALLTAGTVVHFMRGSAPAPSPAVAAPSLAVVAGARPDLASRPAGALVGAEPSARAPGPLHSSIESARRGTVLVKSSWGLGSGFIIDADCHVITNRHVVETDGARVASQVVQDPDTQARLYAARQELQAALYNAHRYRDALALQQGTNLEQL